MQHSFTNSLHFKEVKGAVVCDIIQPFYILDIETTATLTDVVRGIKTYNPDKEHNKTIIRTAGAAHATAMKDTEAKQQYLTL